jgi:hypothetical protein
MLVQELGHTVQTARVPNVFEGNTVGARVPNVFAEVEKFQKRF